jgi:hypothetical protein
MSVAAIVFFKLKNGEIQIRAIKHERLDHGLVGQPLDARGAAVQIVRREREAV